jgi:hypothetical protein
MLLNDPQKIIIQGDYTGAGGYFLAKLYELLGEYGFFRIADDFEICYSRLSFQSGRTNNYLIGAGLFAADAYFQSAEL